MAYAATTFDYATHPSLCEYAAAEGSSSRPKRSRESSPTGFGRERDTKRTHLAYPTPPSSLSNTPSNSTHPSPFVETSHLQAEQPTFSLYSVDEDSSMSMDYGDEQVQQQAVPQENGEVMEESSMEPYADYSEYGEYEVSTSISPPRSSPSYLQPHFSVSATPAVTPSGTPCGSPNRHSFASLPSASHFASSLNVYSSYDSYSSGRSHPLSHPKPSFPPLPSSISSPYRVGPKPLQPISRPHHASLYSMDPRMDCRACNQGISRGRWGHRAGCSEQ